MSDTRFNALFLCTGNSARSIMAESILTSLGSERFVAYSAGSRPTGTVRPEAIAILEHMRLPTAHVRSKSWEEFATPDAPRLDFVFTVCDSAAAETCPVWPGQPITAHWGVPDPAGVEGSEEERMQAHREAFFTLLKRIQLFLNLPLASLDRMSLQQRLDRIGRDEDPDTEQGA